MSQIIITNHVGKVSRYYLNRWLWVAALALFAAISASAFYVGQQFGDKKVEPNFVLTQMHEELARYKDELEAVEVDVEKDMNALAQRLALSQAHVIRLNALGERLIEKTKLDKGEFDFSNEPSLGGPVSNTGERGENITANEFSNTLIALEKRLEKSALQLGVLESMLISQDLRSEVFPAGRPIKKGWISSYFGFRADPFTGRRTHHDGIDLAGKDGSAVIAVAAGVVTWAGKRSGYGQLVEINHGSGYVTRYGHNKLVEVKTGDRVTKGQTISRMGSTGRSTGPHVHFEVYKNGQAVDPMKYVKK